MNSARESYLKMSDDVVRSPYGHQSLGTVKWSCTRPEQISKPLTIAIIIRHGCLGTYTPLT